MKQEARIVIMGWKRKVIEEVLDCSKMLLLALVVSAFVKENVAAGALVPTGSMEETVATGSRVVINKLAYIAEEPERGDIVAFYYPDDGETLYLKRIMGLPGETIEGRDGYVYINGMLLQKDYTTEKLDSDFGPFVIPDGCYFMLGDNRNNSWDSRYWKNTFVTAEEIVGKVKLEFYPEIKILE